MNETVFVLDDLVQIAISDMNDVRPLIEYFSQLHKEQEFEKINIELDACVNCLEMAGRFEFAIQCLEAGGRLFSSFEIALNLVKAGNHSLTRRAENLALRLNAWHILANAEWASQKWLPKNEESRAALHGFLAEIVPESLDCSRELFLRIAPLLNSDGERDIRHSRLRKICVISMHTGFGGAPGKAMRFCIEAARQGFSVDILFETTRDDVNQMLLDQMTDAGVRLHFASEVDFSDAFARLDMKVAKENRSALKQLFELLPLVRPLYKLRSVVRLWEILSRLDYDVVHCIGTLDLQICAYFACRFAKNKGPVLLNPGMMRSTSYARTEVQLLESEFHQSVLRGIILNDEQCCLANNSNNAAKDFEEWLQIPSGSVPTLYNGIEFIEPRPFDRRTRAPGSKYIAVIGRIAHEKRPFMVLEIFKELKKAFPNVFLVWAGDGPLREKIIRFADVIGTKDQILFVGQSTKIPEVLNFVDCVLLVSDGEGLPNVLLEAQGYGVPVVSSDVGGCSDTFTDGETGILVRGHSIAEFVDALSTVLKDEEFRNRSLRNIDHYRSKFSMESMLNRSVELYNTIV